MSDTRRMIMDSFKNLKGNITQNRRYKQEIRKKADEEAEKIFMKIRPGFADVNGNFPKRGPNQSRAYNKASGEIGKQVLKTRMKQAKDKGIVQKF